MAHPPSVPPSIARRYATFRRGDAGCRGRQPLRRRRNAALVSAGYPDPPLRRGEILRQLCLLRMTALRAVRVVEDILKSEKRATFQALLIPTP